LTNLVKKRKQQVFKTTEQWHAMHVYREKGNTKKNPKQQGRRANYTNAVSGFFGSYQKKEQTGADTSPGCFVDRKKGTKVTAGRKTGLRDEGRTKKKKVAL